MKCDPPPFQSYYPSPLYSGPLWKHVWNGPIFRSLYRWCFRKLVPLLQWYGKRHYPNYESRYISRLTDRLVLKTSYVDYAEANNLCFIRDNTSIPVPRVYDVWDNGAGAVSILMEWIDAIPLRDCWETLTKEEKHKIAQKLRGYVDQLHQ
ncbi:hypothetical protein BDZ97DRAFT_1919669 [Flammula alnicola]|nr:hypothetical protein BDZ97DRAFT_1919669 [Flammula alnicola]